MSLKLILDTFCEVYDHLKPYADGEFWEFDQHTVVPGAVYVIGRQQFGKYKQQLLDLINAGTIKAILSNPHEGSDTLRGLCNIYNIVDQVRQKKILLIGGGDMDDEWPCLQYDSFLPKVLDYDENLQAQSRSNEIYDKLAKPYKFLFLNGRYRAHRKGLIDLLQPVLDQAIWSNLDSLNGPVKLLDPYYEFDFYQQRVATTGNNGYIKTDLFNGDWGEIYLKAEPYVDTYFSVISETVFTYPYTFRTEKTWKPIVMGHPWIAHANQNYYKSIRELGFKTFDHLIDESFDQIENNQDRSRRVSEVIIDLCWQDLPTFVRAAEDVCKYNQQHYAEMRPRVRKEFSQRFFAFLKQYNFDE
jgi:hypothetical protein